MHKKVRKKVYLHEMVSLRYLLQHLEKFAVFDLSEKFKREKLIHRLVCSVHFLLMYSLIVGHLWSTITRASRHAQELIQATLEDLILISIGIAVLYFKTHSTEIIQLMTIMESFSRANMSILMKYNRYSKIVLLTIFCLIFCAFNGHILEALYPVADDDLKIRQIVYRTRHPERKHPFDVRIPFVDESKSWVYEIVFLLQVYTIFVLICFTTLIITVLPVIIVHMRGQYDMLATFIEKIGEKHLDSFGFQIYYTNIEINASYYVMMEKRCKDSSKQMFRRIRAYERSYLKQIIQFHQKLLMFQEKVGILFQLTLLSLGTASRNSGPQR
uniref:Odorant receptor n=1 Tax=Cacopsylla melanoneura TaxID=428564 RepID=A0A8D9E9S9_9HEMI